MGSRHAAEVVWPIGLHELYSSDRVALVKLAYLICGDREVAEDLVQDAFVAIAGRWELVEFPKSYIRAIVTNRCRDWLRRRQTAARHKPEAQGVAVIEPDEMWDAIGRLDERRRAAIVLRYYEDLPDEEIAEALDCRPSTVRSMIHRAVKQLRSEVQP